MLAAIVLVFLNNVGTSQPVLAKDSRSGFQTSGAGRARLSGRRQPATELKQE